MPFPSFPEKKKNIKQTEGKQEEEDVQGREGKVREGVEDY